MYSNQKKVVQTMTPYNAAQHDFFKSNVRCHRRKQMQVKNLVVERVCVLVLAVILCDSNAFAQTGSATPRAEVESGLEALVQKIEQLDRSTAVRLDALDRIRAAELKALDDKIDFKKELADVKKDVATNAQKSVDWWVAFLALFLAIIGLAFPFFFTRSLRAQYTSHLAEITRAREEVHTDRAEVESIRNIAQADAAQVARHKTDTAELAMATKLIHDAQSKADTTVPFLADEQQAQQQVKAAAQTIAASPDAPFAAKLLAKGVEAFQSNRLSDAATLFEMAVTEKPDDHIGLHYWGVALGRLANVAEGEARRALRLKEISKYEAAFKLKPDKHGTLTNWGAALGKLAEAAAGEERQALRLDAVSKYEAALKLKPDMPEAIVNWGNALGNLAADTPEERAQRSLLLEAISKYEAALTVQPNTHRALSGWAVALLKLFHLSKDAKERYELLNAVEAKLLAAAQITGHTTYNFGCVAACRGDAKQFIDRVDAIPRGDLPDALHMRADMDLNGIRATPIFTAWWEKKFGAS